MLGPGCLGSNGAYLQGAVGEETELMCVTHDMRRRAHPPELLPSRVRPDLQLSRIFHSAGPRSPRAASDLENDRKKPHREKYVHFIQHSTEQEAGGPENKRTGPGQEQCA